MSAEIIVFPGVRTEREPEMQAPNARRCCDCGLYFHPKGDEVRCLRCEAKMGGPAPDGAA